MATESLPIAHETEIEEGDQVLRDVDPSEEILPLHYTITSYGADFMIDGLVSRMSSGDIVVPTFDHEFESNTDVVGFQRDYVWKKPQADKFLESLLLGMPVPGIFLVREPDGRNLVLDGHQRLKTIHSFYLGELGGKPYKLGYVQQPWAGRSYNELDDEARRHHYSCHNSSTG